MFLTAALAYAPILKLYLKMFISLMSVRVSFFMLSFKSLKSDSFTALNIDKINTGNIHSTFETSVFFFVC